MAEPKLSPELKKLIELDKRLVEVGKQIKILTSLNWPEKLSEEFLADWRKGSPKLPKVTYPKLDYKREIAELRAIMKACDRAHPIGSYIFLTAESYWIAAQMLERRGTPQFTELSISLYGRPTDTIGPQGLSHLGAAQHFIDVTRDFIAAYQIEKGELCLTAEQVAELIRDRLIPYFCENKVEVVIDPDLSSKAAAGAQRIRIRGGACFSRMDVEQLIHHEGFVHMLTALNGRAQPYLGSMALGAPRTTRTQEGLATFAELHTSSIDLSRLRRIALRIPAVAMGLDGASFIDVFKYFLEAGQDEAESFQSAGRVFRGGDPKGKVVFTKDAVYLEGLILTHTFLRKTVQANKYHFAEYLFAGRLTLGDVVALEEFFESGLIAPPRYEPPWLVNRNCLAAYLCYAVFANSISLGNITLEDFRTRHI